MASVRYDNHFMDYTARCAMRSARIIIPHVLATLRSVENVCDFGCARGAWLSVWRESGAEICGVDGNYVDMAHLLIPKERFHPHDLAKPVRLERRFDLVQCLEVAEHLPEPSARVLVESLSTHGDRILFSAAPPGQGGLGHVNEQPYDYWRGLFARQGYVMLDCLRPALAAAETVMPWYRYNLFLFARGAAFEALAPQIRASALLEGVAIPDIAPMGYRLRRALVRSLPNHAQDWLARVANAWSNIRHQVGMNRVRT